MYSYQMVQCPMTMSDPNYSKPSIPFSISGPGYAAVDSRWRHRPS